MTDATAKKDGRGIRCEGCGAFRFRVVYTRPHRDGKIVRCRECKTCRQRVVTWERVVGAGD